MASPVSGQPKLGRKQRLLLRVAARSDPEGVKRKWTLDFAGHQQFTEIVRADYAAAKQAVADVGMK